MKQISVRYDLDNVELHIIADTHIGDPLCDMKLLKERIQHIADTPNALAVLNGDIMNWASKNSVSDVYGEQLTPMQQIQTYSDMFEPIKDKIIAISQGNHEHRAYKAEGIDLTYVVAKQLGLIDCYTSTSALIFLRFGREHRHDRPKLYTIYMIHGSGGGRKEGAKAIRLADMAAIVDADIYIHSHTHLPMIMKQAFYRVNYGNSSAKKVDKLFVNTGATLNYGGYGEAFEFKPSSKATPVIYLDGSKHIATATL